MIQFTSSQAEKYRELINKAADTLTDEEAAYAPMIFERWEPDKDYIVGKRLCHQDKLYKVLIAHTSQATWTYQLLQRVVHRAHQEDDLADVVEAAKLRHPRHRHDRHPGCSALGDRFCFPISDDRNLLVVIV